MPELPVQPEGIDIRAVAGLLSIGLTTAKEWNEGGKLPAPVIRRGRVVRWARSEIVAWLQSGAPSRAMWNQIRDAKLRQLVRGAA